MSGSVAALAVVKISVGEPGVNAMALVLGVGLLGGFLIGRLFGQAEGP